MSDRILRAALVGGGLLASSAALGWTSIGWDWSWQADPMSDAFYINPSSFAGYIGSDADVLAAVRDGMDRWGNEGGADFAFNYGGTTTSTTFNQTDGFHVARYTTTYASGGTLAVAATWGFSDRMTNCDILFYAGNDFGSNNWSSSQSGAGWNEMDLEFVATHEFGHCTGLGHSGSTNAVMFASATNGTGPSQRTLTSDDEAGLQGLYGVGTGGGGGGPTTPLQLTMSGPLVAGQPINVVVSGADPAELVYLVKSEDGLGDGPCPPAIGSNCLGVSAPIAIFDRRQATALGTATFTITPPASFVGLDMALQGVVRRGTRGADSILSNPDHHVVVAAGTSCGGGQVLDCSGDCVSASDSGDGSCDDGAPPANSSDLYCSVQGWDGGDCD